MTLPEEIATMIRQNDMGVLSTCAANAPHASLMAYATLPDLEYILMATSASTRKWANLSANPGMALLIDERCTVPDRTRMRALTVGGTLESPPDDHTQAHWIELLRQRHPNLAPLLSRPDIRLICLKPLWYLLLRGAEDSFFIDLKKNELCA